MNLELYMVKVLVFAETAYLFFKCKSTVWPIPTSGIKQSMWLSYVMSRSFR